MLSALPWQRLLRRELLTLYLVIFIADTVVGYLLPLYPIRARALGATLTLIGAMAAFNGATQVLTSVPAGMLSDRLGRRRLIAAGSLCFAAAATLLALAPTAELLLLVQILLGVGYVTVFAMGAAMVGDYSTPAERGLTMGSLTTAMGLGFATGPSFGGLVAEATGVESSLLLMAMLAAACAVLAWVALTDAPVISVARIGHPLHSLRLLAVNRLILLAAVAHLLFSPLFGGVVVNFMPLHASMLGFSAITIGILFTMRALASTVIRLPVGVLSMPRWSHRLMLTALVLGGSALLILVRQATYPAYAAALITEGISYGMFLTAGQAFVTQYAEPHLRGASVGAYSMAGGIGIAVSPLLLGMLADRIGLEAIILLVGAATLVGAGILAFAFRRAMVDARPAD